MYFIYVWRYFNSCIYRSCNKIIMMIRIKIDYLTRNKWGTSTVHFYCLGLRIQKQILVHTWMFSKRCKTRLLRTSQRAKYAENHKFSFDSRTVCILQCCLKGNVKYTTIIFVMLYKQHLYNVILFAM